MNDFVETMSSLKKGPGPFTCGRNQNTLRRKTLKPKSVFTILILAATFLAATTAKAEPSLYWVEAVANGDLGRLDLGTGEIEIVLEDEGNLGGVAIDAGAGYIYWSGSVGVKRMRLDGSGSIEILSSRNYRAIALDLEAGKLYGSVARRLERMDLTDLSTVVLAGNGVSGVVVDPIDRRVYWSENRNENSNPPVDDMVYWADMDGAFSPQVLYNIPGNFNNQVPSALAIDQATRKLYMALANTLAESVVRSNLAEDPGGLGYELFVDETGGYSLGIAIDANTRQLYWSNLAGEILRTDLDGGGSTTGDGANTEVILSGLGRPQAIAIDGAGTSPPEQCSVVLPLICDGCELSVACQDVIFPPTSLGGQDVIAMANDATWRATDTTALGAGWHVTLIADDHLRGDADPENHMIFVGVNEDFGVGCLDTEISIVSGDALNPPTCSIGPQPVPVAGETPLTLIYADPGQGMGVFDFVPHFETMVPGTTIIDRYTTVIFVDIIAGP